MAVKPPAAVDPRAVERVVDSIDHFVESGGAEALAGYLTAERDRYTAPVVEPTALDDHPAAGLDKLVGARFAYNRAIMALTALRVELIQTLRRQGDGG